MVIKQEFKDLINKNYCIQDGCYISHISRINDSVGVISSDYIDCLIWNHYYLYDDITLPLYNFLINQKLNFKKIAFYFDERDNNTRIFLENRDYKITDIETWMCIKTEEKPISPVISIVLVNNEEEKKIFASELKESFSNQYREAFLKEQKKYDNKRFEHYIVYNNLEYIGIFSLYYFDSICVVHNVATTKTQRHKGLSVQTMYSAVSLAYKNNVDYLYLQCTGGNDGHERVYLKSGFKILFRRLGMEHD